MIQDGEFLKSLVEVSHVEFQSYDFQRHKLIFSSGMAEKFLGYTVEQYFRLSQNFYEEIIHPDDHELLRETIDKITHSSKGEVVEMTARFRRSDGKYVWIYTRKMVADRDKQGNPCTITTVAEDVTNLIDLQQQLKEKVTQLEAVSYKNSHLVRGPVASIIGLLHLIEEEEITTEHNQQIFNYLKQAIEKLDAVIHEINDIAGR